MKSWLAFLFFLYGTIVFYGCNPFDSNNRDNKSAGIGNDPFFEKMTDSITQFPDRWGLYLKRAEYLSQKNLPEKAYADYQKAWTLSKDEFTALSFAANLFMTGREREAINLLQQGITLFPSNREFPRRLSEAYMQMGKIEEALGQFEKILESDSGNFEALYEKGVLLAELKDTMQAIRAFEKAYSVQPLQLVGTALAHLYAETKNKKVLELCNDLISRDSAQELTDAVFIKGIYFANTGQPGPALDQFEDCIRRDWKFTEAYIEKGIILYKENNLDEALKTFALAAKVSNVYPDAYYWMGRCYERIGNKDQARENYLRALGLDKNFTEAKESLRRLN
jgi:tetratricopeptide (TPR) repeat protein